MLMNYHSWSAYLKLSDRWTRDACSLFQIESAALSRILLGILVISARRRFSDHDWERNFFDIYIMDVYTDRSEHALLPDVKNQISSFRVLQFGKLLLTQSGGAQPCNSRQFMCRITQCISRFPDCIEHTQRSQTATTGRFCDLERNHDSIIRPFQLIVPSVIRRFAALTQSGRAKKVALGG